MLQLFKDLYRTYKMRKNLWLAAGFVDAVRNTVKQNKNRKKGTNYLYGKIGQRVVKLLEYHDMYRD